MYSGSACLLPIPSSLSGESKHTDYYLSSILLIIVFLFCNSDIKCGGITFSYQRCLDKKDSVTLIEVSNG
ncbi:hypothetical protein EHE19_003000 [Ruminiclostridium herbifermentans]|uniref:Uncharacterized protein n=1 Tax=Ruminiclostridium herbifermentans TaxID=2488810 RepID=A0A7H1VQ46_9FIRM|nr:hypothetical protein EHE19_003000 [Ruminiclostridium herbifermentans]